MLAPKFKGINISGSDAALGRSVVVTVVEMAV